MFVLLMVFVLVMVFGCFLVVFWFFFGSFFGCFLVGFWFLVFFDVFWCSLVFLVLLVILNFPVFGYVGELCYLVVLFREWCIFLVFLVLLFQEFF